MANSALSGVKKQINRVIDYAKQQLSESEQVLLIPFVKLYFAHVSVDDLSEHSTRDLFGAVSTQWALMKRRKPGELNIRIFNPSLKKDGWQSTHTIIEVVSEDMPFLIDSIRMEVNRLGLMMHQAIHTGGLQVRRDKGGKILEVLPYDQPSEKAGYESPIYMEVDKQTDPDVLKDIEMNLKRVIYDVRMAVDDWQDMRAKMQEMIEELRRGHMPQSLDEVKESIALLEWLLDNHFTFLGVRDYVVSGKGDKQALKLVRGSSLGVLQDDTHSKTFRPFSALPPKVRKLMLSRDRVLVISKTNTRSTVHRRTHTDYVGVKRFNKAGELVGERRFIGLYTSAAYSSRLVDIPFLRHKVSYVMGKSKLPVRSHAGKDLLHILETFPRDDFFQTSPSELLRLGLGILHLQERRRIRLFVREDMYGRFVSCLVYIPRDNFNTHVLNKMQDVLVDAFKGDEATFTTHFSASVLARVHFLIRVDPKAKLSYDILDVESELVRIGSSWFDGFFDGLRQCYGEEQGNALYQQYGQAFPASYRDAFTPHAAIYDVEKIESLTGVKLLAMSLYRPEFDCHDDMLHFKLFRADKTVPLSDVLPILENMGLRVIGEEPYQIKLKDGHSYWINDFSVTHQNKTQLDINQVKAAFQETFYRVWLGEAENGELNKLVLGAQLDWREIALLRSYVRYIWQAGITFSTRYIGKTLVKNAPITRLLMAFFKCRFDPEFAGDRDKKAAEICVEIKKSLNDVAVLDEDRILGHCLAVLKATLRTNFYQVDEQGCFKPYISLKFDSSKVPDMPLPLPRFEIFVYSPRFEAIHLRAAKVARGGIRWSDRHEDFRTEVLGLMKAQHVKNAVIVPAGAKGGFVPKALPVAEGREAVMAEGIACYREFISGLLDLTDNIVDQKTVAPPLTVCYDEPDPYLVVAADKGTATFSDIANSIAQERGFWLDDAFASGGSTGYDHKKMGITARGAWVSVERHFQELGVNIQDATITVVGIGDMAGDVFGNGMLMSRHIQLLAAFNHMHIFIDPTPDVKSSFAERKRLFNLPRSSWEDYSSELISRGGGVFSRSAKSIKITPQMKKLFHITAETLPPNELIKELLMAPVDLLWNGGIGTYVKAKTESNADAGDRSNDYLRIDGRDVRAKVVGEGGNLGLTQLGRIEYALHGGRINTDFIDNSAGVDCSDHEVNIKILLNDVVNSKKLTLKQRNVLLARMTEEVGSQVLQDNYHQNQAISLACYLAPRYMGLYMRYMDAQEDAGNIDRKLEFLPDREALLERKASGQGLTRPELSVLFAYSKIILEKIIRRSDLADDPYLSGFIDNAFPTPLRKRYREFFLKHRLSREIIATQLSNKLVSDMGITFLYQMFDETGAPEVEIVQAYAAARDIFCLDDMLADIDALDYKIDSQVQHQMTEDAVRLVRRSTRWILRNRREHVNISATLEYFKEDVANLMRRLPSLVVGVSKTRLEEHQMSLVSANVPLDVATKIASTVPMYHSLNIIEAATLNYTDVIKVAKVYFTLVDRLDLLWFRDQINSYATDNRWSILARAAYKGDLDWIQRALTLGVINIDAKSKSIAAHMQAWLNRYHQLIARWEEILTELRAATPQDFAIFSVAVRELADLAQTSIHQNPIRLEEKRGGKSHDKNSK